MGGDGGCRVGEVRAGTTSPMPDHKGFKLQQLVKFQKFSTLRFKNCDFQNDGMVADIFLYTMEIYEGNFISNINQIIMRFYNTRVSRFYDDHIIRRFMVVRMRNKGKSS